MNSKTTIPIVALVIVALGGGYFFMNKVGTDATHSSQAASVAATSGPKTIAELVAAGTSQQCTFTDTDIAGNVITGTLYVGDGKMRGDITTQSPTKTFPTHTISDGTMMYTWLDGAGSGFKVSIDATKPVDGRPTPQRQGFDPDRKVNYQCSPWTTDASKFTVPADVRFQDVTEATRNAMHGLPPAGAVGPSAAASGDPVPTPGGGHSAGPIIKGTAAQCALCDHITSPQQKAACRQALSCQ